MKNSILKYKNKGRVPFCIMRKFISFAVPLLALLFTLNSCQDILSTDNDSMVSDPKLNTKTDSVFYALGIAQAMQQVADQYFYIGELRGELVTVDVVAGASQDRAQRTGEGIAAVSTAHLIEGAEDLLELGPGAHIPSKLRNAGLIQHILIDLSGPLYPPLRARLGVFTGCLLCIDLTDDFRWEFGFAMICVEAILFLLHIGQLRVAEAAVLRILQQCGRNESGSRKKELYRRLFSGRAVCTVGRVSDGCV